MSLVRPNAFPEFDEKEFAVEIPTKEETMRKLAHGINMALALLPVGLVKAYQTNMPGTSLPSPRLYQFCDGSEITEPTSPLNGPGNQYTPDMRGRFLRGGYASDTAETEVGGNATVDLTHNHTTVAAPFPGNLLEAGDERRAFEPFHNHGVATDLTEPVPLELAHMKTAFFLKINK